MSHLEHTGYLADQQNGFRRNRSTTKSLATLVDRVLLALDNGEYAVTVFLDFKKAFDTVDHEILMWKLEKAGLGPVLCKLLRNYLKGRTQATRVNNQNSTIKAITTDVPQGSILGPLLFIIFTNDLTDICDIPLYTIFADDTSVTVTGKDLKQIETTLNNFFTLLATWCRENKLTLNPKKTEYMIFGSRAKIANALKLNLILGNEILREVQTYRYLGTTLDQTMSATSQLGKFNQLVAQKLISFRKIR